MGKTEADLHAMLQKAGEAGHSPDSTSPLGQGVSFGSEQCQSEESRGQDETVFPMFFGWLFSGFCTTLLLKFLQLPQSYFCLWIGV